MVSHSARFRQQSGFTVVELLLGVVLLMLPSGFIMFALPQFEGYRHFTSVASREVARTVAFEGGTANAEYVVREYASNFDLEDMEIVVDDSVISLDSMPDPIDGQILVWIHSQTPGVIARGESIEVKVKMKSPLVHIPGTEGMVSPIISGKQTEIVDPYASFRKVCPDGHSVEASQPCL